MPSSLAMPSQCYGAASTLWAENTQTADKERGQGGLTTDNIVLWVPQRQQDTKYIKLYVYIYIYMYIKTNIPKMSQNVLYPDVPSDAVGLIVLK